MRRLICPCVVLHTTHLNTVEFLDIRCFKFKYTQIINETLFRTFFFLSLVYYTQPPSGNISLTLDMFLLCVCEQLCLWQDCADVQARLRLRWSHVREVP